MKLTNYLRDAFIRAAMDDVPKIDYHEPLKKIVLDDAINQLPAKVKAIYQDKATNHYITRGYAYGHGGYEVPCQDRRFVLSESASEKYVKLEALDRAQKDKRNELEKKLRACAYACTTRAALLKMLPEFEKYLPADEEKAIRSLPVVANVVSDFVKAGWPKSEVKPKKEKK